MVSLRRLRVQNYRSLHDIDVALGSLNVLVGPNGAGKSNVLDAIRFLGDTARYDLQEAIELRGGFQSLLFQGRIEPRPTVIRIEVEAEVTRHASPGAPDEYALSFWKPSLRALQRREAFTFKRYQGGGRRITVNGGRVEINDTRSRFSVGTRSTALSTLPRLGEDAGAEQFRQLATLFETFRVFDADTVRARQATRHEAHPVLTDSADNLATFLFWLSEAHAETFDLLCRDLRKVLPGFEAIIFRRFGGAAEGVEVGVKEVGLAAALPLADASYGTIRGLALLALLHDPEPPRLTCVEEIDHGLHPYALDIIVERMRTAAERTQLIVVTHSPALVNRLDPAELIVCERDVETGASVIPAVDAHQIAEMASVSELGLGELWFSGSLGGVPA